MPRLAAHCLHTSIKSSIFLCSTPLFLSTHLSCFATPPHPPKNLPQPPLPFLLLHMRAPVLSRPPAVHSPSLNLSRRPTKPRLQTASMVAVKSNTSQLAKNRLKQEHQTQTSSQIQQQAVRPPEPDFIWAFTEQQLRSIPSLLDTRVLLNGGLPGPLMGAAQSWLEVKRVS